MFFFPITNLPFSLYPAKRLGHYWQETDFYQLEELKRRIKEVVDALPPIYREAFVMHRFKNKSYKEIAEFLQISPKTVDYRIQQALKQLRITLKDYLPQIMLLFPKNILS